MQRGEILLRAGEKLATVALAALLILVSNSLPTRVTYTREIDFYDEGGVWTSNSNFPTWQIEATGPKVIRLQPEAGARRTMASR